LVIGRHVTFDETLILNQTKIFGISGSEATTNKDDSCKSEKTTKETIETIEFEKSFKDIK